MQRTKCILPLVLVIGLMIVAFQASSVQSITTKPSTLPFSPGPNDQINYPNPINKNVTVTGTMTSSIVSPACSLSSPPCAIANSPLYYITVNGWNYRLIFPNSTKLPLNHAYIMVTGVFVTPSTYPASQWMPQMYFRGDIYVITYSYVSPYQ
jgi:hypothetical protein